MARKRRNRIEDRKQAKALVGPTAVSAYIPSSKARHAARLQANLSGRASVEGWCSGRGVGLRITNGGHHWQFRRGAKLVEWWPSSAKLVMNKRWNHGIHTHGYDQVLRMLEAEFPQETTVFDRQ